MAVQDWIDTLAALWEIDDGKGGTVKSYRLYEKAEFPEAVTQFPCALTYTTQVENQYSLGGPCIDFWRGATEFHLAEGTGRQHYPEIMRYFARIRDAAAGNITLNGRVSHFLLRLSEGPSVQGPVVLQYGGEQPHLGLVVYWEVKEVVSVQAASYILDESGERLLLEG